MPTPNTQKLTSELNQQHQYAHQIAAKYPRPEFTNAKLESRINNTHTKLKQQLTSHFRVQTMKQLHPTASIKEISHKEQLNIVSTAELNKKLVLKLAKNNQLNDSMLSRLSSNIKLAVEIYNRAMQQHLERSAKLREQHAIKVKESGIDLNSPTSIMLALQMAGTDAANQYDINQGSLQQSINDSIAATLAAEEKANQEQEIETEQTEDLKESNNTPKPSTSNNSDDGEDNGIEDSFERNDDEGINQTDSDNTNNNDITDDEMNLLDDAKDFLKAGHTEGALKKLTEGAEAIKSITDNLPSLTK